MTKFINLTLAGLALTLIACDAEPDGEVNEDGVTVIETDGMTFSPSEVTIAAGDTVRFVLADAHNALEVGKDAFDNREKTPLDGGFYVDFGETAEITFEDAGTYWYVCEPHVGMDMVGKITVE